MADWWTEWPWRLIQTNLREIDMQDIDAQRFVADLQEFGATVVLLNAAGIIASYRTSLPFHFQSEYLTGSSLQEIIAACHLANIRVLARTDFSKIRRPIYEEHPDWAYRTSDGRIVDYNGDVHTCINGDYQQKYMLEILKELFAECDFDGIFFNMSGYQVRDYSGNYYGICHCAACQRRFAEATGLGLPTAEDMNDPVYRKYVLFKRWTAAEHQRRVCDLLYSLRPDLCIANDLEGRRGIIRQEANTAVDRPLPHWQYSASANTKWATSSYPEMIASTATVDFIDIPYRHVAVSPEQQRLRLAQNLANGGGLDLYIMGRLDNHEDKSGFAAVKEMFSLHAAHEEEFRGLRSLGSIALLTGPDANEQEFRGWFRFLLEGHYFFDTLRVERALEPPLTKYRAIIVPDYQPLSDDLAACLDDFVAGGGVLVAIGHAGFRDGNLERRSAPALKSPGLEGVDVTNEHMRSAYLKIAEADDFPHLANTGLIYLDGTYMYGRYAPEVEPHLRLIPPHPYGPPERCYYTQVTAHPGFTVNRFGKGLALHVPWLPGTLFYRQGHTNTFDFALDLLEHFAGLEPATGNLSPMVELTLFEQQASGNVLLQLVNGSGHFGTSFYRPVPMADLRVTIPGLRMPRSVSGLVSGKELPFSADAKGLTMEIPYLQLYEACKIVY